MIYYPAFRSIIKQCGNKDDFVAKVKNADNLNDSNAIMNFVSTRWEAFHFIVVMSNDMKSFLELLKILRSIPDDVDIYGVLAKELYAIKCGKYNPSLEASDILKDLKQLHISDISRKIKPSS